MVSRVLLIVALASVAAANIIPVHHAPQPYKFGYNVKDKHGDQYREETGDGHSGVKGSYGFTDARGIKRQVAYVADKAGFRAQVKTNEPGTANQNPAAVKMISNAPYSGGVALGGMGYGYGVGNAGLGYGNLGLGYGVGNADLGYGNLGLGYGVGNAGLGYGNLGLGYGMGVPSGVPIYGGYGLEYGGSGLLGGLGYARYGY